MQKMSVFRKYLDLFKTQYKALERWIMTKKLCSAFSQKTAVIVGPSKVNQLKVAEFDFAIVLKLYSTVHISLFDHRKIILVWNGTTTEKYLMNREPLPQNIFYIFAKCNKKQYKEIRKINPNIRVVRFRSLSLSTKGQQTLVVDVISIFRDFQMKKLFVTGIDLRLFGYRRAYKRAWGEHNQVGNLERSIKAGHDPLLDFSIMQSIFMEGGFTPDDTLRSVLALTKSEYIRLFMENNKVELVNDEN